MKLFPIAPERSNQTDTADHGRKKRWRGLLSEPLLHFLVVGMLLFGFYRIAAPQPETTADSQKIELTKDDMRQLAVTWLAQGRPLPTPEQMQILMDQKVTQEILFREAVALGLDRDDEIVKRRMAQKMDFLAADLATIDEPSPVELKVWFEHNSDRFSLPPHASFRHLYFSFDKRGQASQGSAAAALALIADKSPDSAEVAAVADPFMFRTYYGDATPEQTAKEFGPEFAKALFNLTPGSWQGPIQSGYGWHLVRVESIEPGRVPAFEEVAPEVKSAWLDDRYREIKSAALDEMRSRYVVTLPSVEPADLEDLQRPLAAGASSELFAQ
ncbi:peptidylprolyl isomerase [Phyllobacterium sp. LjRoot231]|uniref:peptidylprolyl isomerase n=1 Tax=Phyllobacterium sp. LjRoot231 TaxID=3342289 RepID=UPI003ED0D60D